MPPISKRKRTMIIKQEATRGTFVTWPGSWADTDFDLRFFNIQVSPEIEGYTEKFALGDHDMVAAVMGKQMCKVTASVLLRWSGAVDTSPNVRKALMACGLLETVNASTSVTWQPSKEADLGGGVSGSLDLPFDIMIQDEVMGSSPGAIGTMIRGALANGKLMCDQLGHPWRLDLEFTGVFDGCVDIANANILAPSGLETAQPDVFLSATMTMATVAQKVSKFELDFGNVVELEEDPSDSTGYLAAMITDREPKLGIDPRVDLLANDPKYTRWSAGTETVLAIASSHFALDADKCQLMTVADAERSGMVAYDEAYNINRDDSNGYPWILTHS